jgi:RNA polymerase sigma-70 factor (ECF subfamily)
LIPALARRDPQAIRQLYELYGSELYRFALARLRSTEDAADVLQETLLAAIESAPGFRGESSLRTWLFGICRHKIQDALQARSRGAAARLAERAAEGDGRDHRDQFEESLAFWESFGRLAPRQQEILILACHYGFSQEEIAEVVGVPVGTVKSRAYYARRRLRELMRVDGGEHRREKSDAAGR